MALEPEKLPKRAVVTIKVDHGVIPPHRTFFVVSCNGEHLFRGDPGHAIGYSLVFRKNCPGEVDIRFDSPDSLDHPVFDEARRKALEMFSG